MKTETLIEQVVIVGGIHGNELTGIYLVKKFEKYPHLIQRNHLQVTTLLGNPRAIAARTRYTEKDLNRCFHLLNSDCLNSKSFSYEDHRAREIQSQLKPKSSSRIPLILDLHSTTANMGLTLILGSHHPLILQLAAALVESNPLVRVYSYSNQNAHQGFLRSLSELSLTIEVGAVAQNILDANLLLKTETLIQQILDYCDRHNQGKINPVFPSLKIYEHQESIDYPRDEQGEIQAMIHPQLQGKDYSPLYPGDPLFLTFDGRVISYQKSEVLYPVFINEASYYEKGIALYLTQQKQLALKSAAIR